jgi:hypothetical protein
MDNIRFYNDGYDVLWAYTNNWQYVWGRPCKTGRQAMDNEDHYAHLHIAEEEFYKLADKYQYDLSILTNYKQQQLIANIKILNTQLDWPCVRVYRNRYNSVLWAYFGKSNDDDDVACNLLLNDYVHHTSYLEDWGDIHKITIDDFMQTAIARNYDLTLFYEGCQKMYDKYSNTYTVNTNIAKLKGVYQTYKELKFDLCQKIENYILQNKLLSNVKWNLTGNYLLAADIENYLELNTLFNSLKDVNIYEITINHCLRLTNSCDGELSLYLSDNIDYNADFIKANNLRIVSNNIQDQLQQKRKELVDLEIVAAKYCIHS